MRLMSWNIHGGIGPDAVFDINRIAALIERHAPDIVALQEVDTRERGPQAIARLHRIYDPTTGHHAEAHTMTGKEGTFGNVIFSRWPLTAIVKHDISHGTREPRIALDTTVETPSGPLHLIAVHLGLALAERSRQAAHISGIIKGRTGQPTIALGDFNEWLPFGAVQRVMGRILPVQVRLATFPAQMPFLSLDRIYCARALEITRRWTDPEARHCSDHLPVIADIRLA